MKFQGVQLNQRLLGQWRAWKILKISWVCCSLLFDRVDCRVTLLDSAGKKSRFCRHVCTTLCLDNVAVVNDRIEYFEGSPFQTVVSRAFASLADAYTLALRLLAEGGAMVAMKGKLDPAELAALKAQSACVVDTQRVRPVGVEGERHIVVAKPA